MPPVQLVILHQRHPFEAKTGEEQAAEVQDPQRRWVFFCRAKNTMVDWLIGSYTTWVIGDFLLNP